MPGDRYAAFISYSHADEKLASWLHRKLEAYRVPGALVGRAGANGRIGKRLGKFFRDRVELGADHDLGGEIRAALERSDALIVLCSPRAAQSRYVHEEIRHFKSLGRGERIMAAIVEGEPHARGKSVDGRTLTDADECFPTALVRRLGDDGQISDAPEPTEPIAADFRKGKDEHEAAKLKLIAGLLGVGLDDLVQRERVAQRWRTRAIAALAVVLAGLAAAAAGFAVLAQMNANEARLQAARVTEQLAAQRLRAGDVGLAVDLLSGVARANLSGVADMDRVSMLAAGLTPLDAALARTPAWTPLRWNGRAYVRGETASDLHDLGAFAPTTWAASDRFIALMNGDGEVLVFDKTGGETRREDVGRDMLVCEADIRSDGGMDIYGLTQSGVTLGGTTFSRWRIGADGALSFEAGGRDQPFGRAELCPEGRIDPELRAVAALAFPTRLDEQSLWSAHAAEPATHAWIAQTFAQPTGLGGETLQALFDLALRYRGDWYAAHRLTRGDAAFVMGAETHGMGGERWAFCGARAGAGACTLFSFAHIAAELGGVRISRDGRTAAAFGLGFNVESHTPEFAAALAAWEAASARDPDAPYPEPPSATGNVFIARDGAYADWRAPAALNALGRIEDLAFSPDGERLALISSDSLFIADAAGAEAARTPFGLERGELRAVAWRDGDVVLLAASDLSLSALDAESGSIAWDRLDLAALFAPCDHPDAHPEDYENTIWLASDPQSGLAAFGRGDCAIVIDARLGAPVTGLVRLDGGPDVERAPLRFDRPGLAQRGDGVEIDFYWTRFSRRGPAAGQSLAALTGRSDGALARSLLDVRRPQ